MLAGAGLRGLLVNISEAIGRRSRVFVSVVTLALTGVAITARYFVPPRFSVAFVFLVPISFATWFLSWVAGSMIALAGALFLFYFDLRFTDSGLAGARWNGFINVVVATTFIYIFAELRALYMRQIDLSRRDPLTGQLNRRAFIEMVVLESHRMARHRRPLTIAYVDVDDFKLINDRYGHAAGDEFLRGLGRNIATRLRITDCLARVGGDEFAILLPETDEAAARRVMGEIHNALRHFSSSYTAAATVSVGAVTFASASSAEAMLAMADGAMYAIKQAGKNNVAFKLEG
jgi:diguanylate cyclase (GGDEF)-like protein